MYHHPSPDTPTDDVPTDERHPDHDPRLDPWWMADD